MTDHEAAVVDQIRAQTRLTNAQAAEIEARLPGAVAAHPELPFTPAAEPVKIRKPRTPKEEKPAEAVAPVAAANPNDDILGPSVATAKPAPAAVEMTEDESAKAATARAKTLMQRFDKIPAGQVAGQEKPEGYLIAKKIMVDDFKVARIADMVHAQRLQFIVKVDQILAERK